MAVTDEKLTDEPHMRESAEVPSDKSGSDDEFAITWTEKEESHVRHKLDWQIVSRCGPFS
jgi:hypothetical protein